MYYLIIRHMKNIYLKTAFVLALMLIITGNALAIEGKRSSGTGFETGFAEDSTLQSRYHDPGLKKVVQVAIVVRDIEASSKLWADLLGMPVPEISTTRPGHEVKEIYRGKPSEGQVKLTFFNLGQVVIELLQPISEGTSWKEFLDKKGEGVQHLGFQVEDPDKTSAELEKAGYPIIHQGRYDSNDGTYIYHETLDALGVVVELLHSDTKK
jgi:catechol 2,3-dioxygenase-like lactoylglutathione lyase family enzyme